jgi:opacity protein-like surface antigen
MRRIVFLIALLALFPLVALAEDVPKAEVFGGYQFTHFGSSGASENFNGWNASVTGNFNKYFGVAADFSGSYKTISGVSVKAYTYAFGPVVSLNHEGTVNPFVHALFGGAHLSGSLSSGGFSGSASTNGFTMAVGGGVDAKVAPHVAVRLFQADWVYFHFQGQSFNNNVRVSTGLVFRF